MRWSQMGPLLRSVAAEYTRRASIGDLARATKKAPPLVQGVQPLEVEVAAVHDVERASFDVQRVQHVHVVQLAVAEVDERGNRPAQVQQRAQLDGRLGGSKRRPAASYAQRGWPPASAFNSCGSMKTRCA